MCVHERDCGRRSLESCSSKLPSEIEVAPNPQQIAEILSESLHQHVAQSGVPDTVVGLQSKVESANRYLVQTLERRTKPPDALIRLQKDLLRIWTPLASGRALFVGTFARMGLQGCKKPQQVTNRVFAHAAFTSFSSRHPHRHRSKNSRATYITLIVEPIILSLRGPSVRCAILC